MDYVSNENVTVVGEKRADQSAALLAYDMHLAAKRNERKKGKEKERNA